MNELLPVAILAGGLATRLRPLTEKIPKSLLEVAGRPFIDHQLRLLARQGGRRVVVCAGFLGEMIEQHVARENFGLDVRFSYDGAKLLGTGGAIKQALPLLGGNFLVMYGDSYLTCGFQAVQRAFLDSGKLALMTVYHNRGQYDRSNVVFAGGQVTVYDKKVQTPAMQHIDYGLGAFAAAALDVVPVGAHYDLSVLYQEMLRSGQLAAVEVAERFYEIGSPEGLVELRELLKE